MFIQLNSTPAIVLPPKSILSLYLKCNEPRNKNPDRFNVLLYYSQKISVFFPFNGRFIYQIRVRIV